MNKTIVTIILAIGILIAGATIPFYVGLGFDYIIYGEVCLENIYGGLYGIPMCEDDPLWIWSLFWTKGLLICVIVGFAIYLSDILLEDYR